MVKNDYRRAFIMLRSVAAGYGGHARLERRTLTGSLCFVITAPEGAGPLAAALAGRQNGQYYAAPLGAFQRDRRGQLTLAASFDPRSIDGRPLEAYWWVAVADAGGTCRVVLTGNVDGSREVDPAALERAVCAAVRPAEEPAADLPGPGESDPTPMEGDVKIYRSARARAAEAVPANAEVAPVPRAVPPAEPEPEPAPLPGPEEVLAEVAEADAPKTAAQALGLDITSPWPDPAEPLRRLFATQAPAEAPTDGDYTWVAAAMPAGSGFDDCLIGLRARDGQIAAIRYALPGVYAPEPPAGLEDYAWNDAGYWVLDIGLS